ncbi:NAD-dependent protein deacylase [Achaetomium macrosporum]|uniref:NAD-dependent protein deacylase n=1 Tax=Achaetomium macrosporum TaxID=79813 RepID=A0AAN7CJ52_9PEZI|nr:NAD-dependent protein deacylase [Achaetomium macrosporum]
MAPSPEYNSVSAFHAKLARSKRILAVCGAGLSASSGLPTFRGAGGLWRNYEATALATPEAFKEDPGLVWMFYAYRRHMALQAKPNAGHYALAALARKNPDFLCLSQNVDNLHPRAGHPPSQLHLLHGSLFKIKCSSPTCDWSDPANFSDPFCPALAPASEDAPSSPDQIHPLLDTSKPLPHIPASELPHCPACGNGLQRPGVVWFGEALDEEMLDAIYEWIAKEKVDLVLVVGTSSLVWPAAGFAEVARSKGETSVVTVNLDAERPENVAKLKKKDFAFAGDAAEVLPRLLEPVIGKAGEDGRFGG